MEIRNLHNDDLDYIVDIQKKIIRSSVNKKWYKMLSDHIKKEEQIGLVAEVNNNVVGFVLGEIKIGRFGSETSGWIETVGINPSHMDAGIGKALTKQLLKIFHSKKVNLVFTSVLWNSGDMLAFFKNIGFELSSYINLQLNLNK